MSSFPFDFWTEFDKRLDKRLEENLNNRLAPIEKKLSDIDDRLKKVEATVKRVDAWTQRQDNMIELELHRSVRSYFERTFQSCLTVVPTVIPKELNDVDGTGITEFDGLLVVTNSRDVVDIFAPNQNRSTKSNKSPKTAGEIFQEGVVARLVIIEAKQDVTLAKVKTKVVQKERIEKLLLQIKTNPEKFPQHFLNIGFQFLDPYVGLYVGGQEINPSVKEYIKEKYEKYNKIIINKKSIMLPTMGWLELNGARFDVHDERTDFGDARYNVGGTKRPLDRSLNIK